MKKTIIALAVAGFSFNAVAADLTAKTITAPNYASEIVLPAVVKTGADKVLDTTVELGFSATEGVKRYVRFDLTNAVFETAVKAADLTLVGDARKTKLPDSNISISQGGLKGGNFVVIEITPAKTIANSDKLNFELASVKATAAASIQYRLYETGVDASAANASTLAGTKGPLVGFKSVVNVKAEELGADSKIDVAEKSMLFDDGKEAKFGKLSVQLNDDILALDGTTISSIDTVIKSFNVEVEGSFAAGEKDGNKLAKDALKLGNESAKTLTEDKAVFAYNPAKAIGTIVSDQFTYTVDGKTAIAEQTLTGKFVPIAQDKYKVSELGLGVLGELKKNGSKGNVDLALKPNGAFSNYVRISNKSDIAGDFFLTVIADDGKSVNFPLSAVADQPAALNAGASTTQMTIEQVFAAAKQQGLALSGQGKLRLIVEGLVPENTGGLSVQTYTVAKDGNSFATFK